jgi:hypothetical protein
MRIITVFLAVVAILAITSCSQERVEVTPTLDLEAEKAVLESSAKKVYDALTTQDAEEIDRLVSPQLTGFFGNADFRGTLGREAWHSPETEGTSIVVNQRKWMIAPGLAVSTSSEIWTLPGAPDREFLVTTVWEKRAGQWTVVHIHQSEVGP